ncbi:hypothetical protein Tsp_07444 [Trichinella spiralis]|uniref:hypothetical protein n=1 Tax=Trichinella spiralis TaxID=6334 RepID=UPI0001EFCD58|nr:hypothetical protein Tsp_07444 [Trichinella spiralis]
MERSKRVNCECHYLTLCLTDRLLDCLKGEKLAVIMSKQNKKKIGKYQRKEQGLYDKIFESLMSAALDAAPKEPNKNSVNYEDKNKNAFLEESYTTFACCMVNADQMIDNTAVII